MSENQNNSENTQNEKNTSAEKENRREKLNTLRGMGINPFPNSYDVTYKSKMKQKLPLPEELCFIE